MDIVDETLKAWRRSAFCYGLTDCLMSVGEYMAGRGGVNVPAWFRGTYSDIAGAEALMTTYGGAAGLIDLCGFPPIDLEAGGAPERGDVVVFNAGPGLEGQVGALCTGAGIAVRLERGVIEVERRLVRITHAWKVT